MKRKCISRILAAFLVVGMLAGCGNSAGTTKSAADSGAAESTADKGTAESAADTKSGDSGKEASGEAEKIVVTYVTQGTTPTDMQVVQDAVNAITVPDINVEVEFMPIALASTYTNYSTYIASGERVDLMLLLFQDGSTYYRNGSIEPLNDLLDSYGSTISKLGETYPILASEDGEVYGIGPVNPYYGNTGSIYVKKEYLKGVEYEEKEQYTYADLTEIFAAMKKANPDVYPYGAVGNSITSSSSTYALVGGVVDPLAASIRSGVLMSTDSTEIVNLFETEEYYNFLKQVKEWYDAGYIMTDAATTDSTIFELVKSGVAGSQLNLYNPIVHADEISIMGDVEVFKVTENYYPSSTANTICWTVPVVSQAPEAAMKFLDYTFENADLMNLIQWGIDGTHWKMTDSEGVIDFAEGIDGDTSGYYNTFGVWGDRREQYVWSEVANKDANKAYTDSAMSNPTKAVGYAYNSSAMTNQIAAVDAVLTQYMPSLETGSVSDLDTVYEEFLSALKTAGIDEIIADNQAQFDKWLAQK